MKAVQNPELVKAGREAAEMILKKDPELKNYPLLKKGWIVLKKSAFGVEYIKIGFSH